MFDIDFRHVAYNLLPHFLRGDKNLSWLYSLVEPIKELNIIFNSFRDNTLYNLQFTGQTIYLEHFLNDQFDPIGRGIYITTLDELDWIFHFQKAEAKPPFYYYNASEGMPFIYLKNQTELLNEVNFIVNVPVAVVFDELFMRAKIDYYNHIGRIYEIVTY